MLSNRMRGLPIIGEGQIQERLLRLPDISRKEVRITDQKVITLRYFIRLQAFVTFLCFLFLLPSVCFPTVFSRGWGEWKKQSAGRLNHSVKSRIILNNKKPP